MKESIELAVIGRSNSGKSTLVSMFLADKKLGKSLYQNNEKGKTKLNTKYILYKEWSNTSFTIIPNDKVLEFYIFSEDNENKLNRKMIKRIIKDFKDIIPDINMLSECEEDNFSMNFNLLIKNYIEDLKKLDLVKLFELSEEYPTIRNLIELVEVKTCASDMIKQIMDRYKMKFISIIDTKGFGDTTSLIEYEFPRVDAALFMISDKYIDSDYEAMKSVVADQIKKVPTILCARGQKLREDETIEIVQNENIIKAFDDYYADSFSNEGSPAEMLKKYLKETGIIQTKSYAEKSMMELYLSDKDIFRTLPYILKVNEKSGKNIVTEDISIKSEMIYCEIVEDILNRAVYAKVQEDESISNLIEKISNDKISNEIRDYIVSIYNKYVMEASISPVLNNKRHQIEYFGKAVLNPAKFIDTVHRYIHGPRGGITGYYAYNYDRLAISSYVCLEKCFEELQSVKNPYLDFAQTELIIRKVRRDLCRYGKLAGFQDGYRAYIDYNKLCLAYDQESSENGPWKEHFYDWSYAYDIVRSKINSTIDDLELNKAQHASSIYYGVINRAVLNAINDLLSAIPKEINEFIIK